MNQRSRRKSGGVMFDLTPLLDITLIIMFFVLVQSGIQSYRVEQELRDNHEQAAWELHELHEALEQELRDSYETAVQELHAREENFRRFDEGRLDGGNIYTISISASDMADGSNEHIIFVRAHNKNATEIHFSRLSNPYDHRYANIKNTLIAELRTYAENIEDDKNAIFVIFEYIVDEIGSIEYTLIREAMREFMIGQQAESVYVFIAEHRKLS